MTSVKKNVTLQ